MNPRKKYRLGYQATPLPSRRSVPPCRAPDDQPSPPPEACWVASAARSAACLAASSSCSADFLAASAPRSDRAQRHRPAAGRTAHRPGLQRLRGGRASVNRAACGGRTRPALVAWGVQGRCDLLPVPALRSGSLDGQRLSPHGDWASVCSQPRLRPSSQRGMEFTPRVEAGTSMGWAIPGSGSEP